MREGRHYADRAYRSNEGILEMIVRAGNRPLGIAFGLVLMVILLAACSPEARTSPLRTDGSESLFPTGQTSRTNPQIDRDAGQSAISMRPPTPSHATLNAPLAAASEWLTRYRSATWMDSTATAWIDRVRPTVTDDLAGEYESFRNGTASGWSDFVDRQCVTTAENVESTIPSEVPATETAAIVLVNGRIVTRCKGQHESSEEFAAVVGVVRTPDGSWRVDERVE
ncbi:hypothetical protein [Embleya sp. NPDC001921]